MAAMDIITTLIGGGLIGAITALLSMRSTLRKASADASRAEAETERVRMDNTEHATRVLMDNIVKPLQDELNETRKCLRATKGEITRLRKSIDAAGGCRHRDGCPVLAGLRDEEADQQPEPDKRGQRGDRGGSKSGGEP
ncbi:MAG: hypothetical protein ACI4AJ_02150 [Bacteroidaceae bacterium]